MPEVRMRKARAREILRPLRKYIRVAARHGLSLSRTDFHFVDGGLALGGEHPNEWIITVCGCWEDGGTVDRCVIPEPYTT